MLIELFETTYMLLYSVQSIIIVKDKNKKQIN